MSGNTPDSKINAKFLNFILLQGCIYSFTPFPPMLDQLEFYYIKLEEFLFYKLGIEIKGGCEVIKIQLCMNKYTTTLLFLFHQLDY